MDLINSFLNLAVPPATLVMLAFAWPALFFIHTCDRLYHSFSDDYYMDDKVVIVTGASSGIGEQIAYEYAKRRATLVLVARRETRLRAISEKALQMGANQVMIIAADVVKEDDCRRFVNETINIYGRVDHLVNTTSLSHTFYVEEVTDTSVFPHLLVLRHAEFDVSLFDYGRNTSNCLCQLPLSFSGHKLLGNVYPSFVALPYLHRSNGRIVVNASVENWLPLPRLSIYSAAKAALVNFYETLRFELSEEVGITIATHGWVGSEMARGKSMLEEGAETQWKEEREVEGTNGAIEKFARSIVAGACRGDAYVKYPGWYDIFLLYRVFIPNVLGWTLRLLMSRRAAPGVGVGRPMIESPTRNTPEGTPTRPPPEGTSPRRLLAGPLTFSQKSE